MEFVNYSLNETLNANREHPLTTFPPQSTHTVLETVLNKGTKPRQYRDSCVYLFILIAGVGG